jgi:methionyl-tRNA formyltransferase
MRIAFMGSAELSCPSLMALTRRRDDEIVAVVCQPDRPRGRELHSGPCAVKRAIAESGVPILTPPNVNVPESVEALRALKPDAIVVVAYGQILRRPLLAIPALGCINLHASLLPRYRGAAPVQWAIARGETVTGVTSMMMNEAMDAGDILLQQDVGIAPEDTAGTLLARLAEVGAELLLRTVDDLRAGTLVRKPQDAGQATLAPKLSKADGKLNWSLPAKQIHDRVRGFNPWPGCFCALPGGLQRLKILQSRVEPGAGVPARVLELSGDGPLVAAGEGAVRLLRVQPEGKKPMLGADYARGHALRPGDMLA